MGACMTNATNEKTAEHLMNLVATRNGRVPNFALLLGAGASITSGVKTAEEMIQDWRELLYSQSEQDIDYGQWFRQQSWHGTDEEYSLLFEEVCDQPAQRRVFIEECVRDARPSLGYVYLADLLANRFFDIVFTTNFDDLLNEACYLFSDMLRPMVAAHDSAIQGIRVSSERPKIVKLHGDFLYDNIKNTISELETLESNTKKKLGQFAKEYGLIVIGYSGRDRSVMDNLDLLLRDEENFPHGVYWCLRKGATPSNRLANLLSKPSVYPVWIDGFDEFSAELHTAAGLDPPKSIARPLDMARERARMFLKLLSPDEPLRNHKIIGPHLRKLREGTEVLTIEIPLQVKAASLASHGHFDAAIPLWQEVYEQDPTDKAVANGYARALADAGRTAELSELLDNSTIDPHNLSYFLLMAGRNQDVVDISARFIRQPSSLDRSSRNEFAIVMINRAIAFKRLDQSDAMSAVLDTLEQFGYDEVMAIAIAIAALRGNKEQMIALIQERSDGAFSAQSLRIFPLFEDYQQDPDFVKLIESLGEEADGDEGGLLASHLLGLSQPTKTEELE